MTPVSAVYGNIPGYAIFWALFALALGLFLQRMNLLTRILRLGQKEERSDQVGRRLQTMLAEVLLQRCSLKSLTRQDLAGLGHALLFWGFSLFLISYLLFIGLAGLGLSLRDSLERAYGSILDIFGVLVMAAVVWAAVRRYILHPERLKPSPEAGIILLVVFTLMSLHFAIEGFGYAASGARESLPPVGMALAGLLAGRGFSASALEAAYQTLWWAHYALILGFMVFIPRSKHLHILLSPVNLFFKSLQKGVLKPIDLEKAKSFGVSRLTGFTWKQLLDLPTCTVCGRCHVNCPAQLSGKRLSPREVILNLKEHLFEVGPRLLAGKAKESPAESPKELIGGVVTEEEVWDCTTCRACEQVCPVGIEHVAKLVDLRRHLAMEKSQLPQSAQEALQSLGTRGHPWRGTTAARTDWASGLGIPTLSEAPDAEVLYWVGCTAALEERNMKVARATAKVLQEAGVKFAILGVEEGCCGDPARRLGDEYLFQTLCQQNIELLKGYRVQKILTTCPHCFHSLGYEYPQFGGSFQVVHHTQFIADLIKSGKLKMGSLESGRVAYHDACYLGRYHDIYREPRQVLKGLGGLQVTELARSREKSFCCGGGGGHLWMEEPPEKRVNHRRVEEIVGAKVELVATACPYCLAMLEDGIKARGVESLKALDISELVVLSLGKEKE